jgi:hypothetical protein
VVRDTLIPQQGHQPILQQSRQSILRRFRPIFVGAAILVAAYLFLAAVSYEDRTGARTLSWFAPLLTLLRGLGHSIEQNTTQIFLTPLVMPLLGVAAAITLLWLRRFRPQSWRHDLALALVVPAFVATAILVLRGDLVPAVLAGLLAGICLVACGGAEHRDQASRPLLFLIPLGLGALLRFYALSEVPNGYAEHSVVHHVGLSLPYLEALSSSLRAVDPQPFLGVASNALVHEQFGFISLIAAVGFKLFGVTLAVTRLTSAALGTLTIYVAYRLGRELGGARLGLVFSFLLAVSPWHVAISRYGDQEHVVSPLQFLLSVLFVVLAVNGGKVRDLVLAALFTALTWYIYAANLVVPVIIGLFLLCRAVAAPRQAVRNWWKIGLALGCFVLLSFSEINQLLAQGLLQANVRQGYDANAAALTDFARRWQMAGLEADQLFRQATDPWFGTPGGGLGVFQSTLLVPGLVLAVAALRTRRTRDLALLLLIGLALTPLPAIFAPDVSFRRLMLVLTLIALLSAFTLVRLADAAQAAAVSPRVLAGLAGAGALALAAAGAFGYFDQVVVGEELSNGWHRTVAEAVIGSLGKEPLVVVVPFHDHVSDTNHYITLMAYDTLQDAQRRGVPRSALYTTMTCEDPIESSTAPAGFATPPRLIVSANVLEPHPPCGPDFVARLSAHYPGSTVVIAKPAPLPPDLAPAPP